VADLLLCRTTQLAAARESVERSVDSDMRSIEERSGEVDSAALRGQALHLVSVAGASAILDAAILDWSMSEEPHGSPPVVRARATEATVLEDEGSVNAEQSQAENEQERRSVAAQFLLDNKHLAAALLQRLRQAPFGSTVATSPRHPVAR